MTAGHALNWGIEIPLADEQARDTGSARLLERAARSIPGGVNTAKRRVEPPLCVRSARGARIEDVDGRRLIDYHCAYGAVFLGHAQPEVMRRVAEATRHGVLFGLGVTEGEVALAEKIVAHVPCAESVLLCGSGSEATLHAIRLARAAIGRPKIIKFQGCYHGFHDYVARNYLSLPSGVGRRDPFSAGLLASAVDNTLVCGFNDLEGARTTFEREDGRIAAVIVEPIAHNAASIPPAPGFLDGLRALCDRHGAVLIFDEVITGFRHHLGGYSALAEVEPDLVTLGKALGNGFPIAAVAGHRALMERFNTAAGGDVWFAGTYNGNVPGVTAALATIELIEREDVHGHVFRLGERLRKGLAEVTARASVPAIASGFGSVFTLCFMDAPLATYEDVLRNDVELFVTYRRELARLGAFEVPENLGRSHLTYSHTDADVDETLEAAETALRRALDAIAGPSARPAASRRSP